MFSKEILWKQLGAAIEMLDNAIRSCPEEVWSDRERQPEFWYTAYHALFFLDLDLSGSLEGFAPPAPFTLSELDPAGVLPERTYTQAELGAYAEHCRQKCREVLANLTEETADRLSKFDWVTLPFAERLLYTLRHVQHHTGQLHLILRQTTNSAPGWVKQTKGELFVR